MANLQHLKVHNVPKAFAQWAERHNDLVDLIASIEGAYGIDIQVVHNPKPKGSSVQGVPGSRPKPSGKIRVTGVPTAWDGSISGGGGGNSNSNSTTANTLHFLNGVVAIDVDGTNGVRVSNAVNGDFTELYPSGAFESGSGTGTRDFKYSPNTGIFGYLNGSNAINFNAAGINVSDGTGSFSTLEGGAHARIQRDASNYFEIYGVSTHLATGTNYFEQNENGSIWQTASHSALFQFAALTHDMSIKTINVCVGNSVMQMLIFASDPF